jgi:hypothetical protein
MSMIYLFVVYWVGVRGISEMHARLKNHMCGCFGTIKGTCVVCRHGGIVT